MHVVLNWLAIAIIVGTLAEIIAESHLFGILLRNKIRYKHFKHFLSCTSCMSFWISIPFSLLIIQVEFTKIESLNWILNLFLLYATSNLLTGFAKHIKEGIHFEIIQNISYPNEDDEDDEDNEEKEED